MTARLGAERTVEVLNGYLGCMTEVIRAEGGTIDSFIGDAILVLFGAPFAQEDHADRAVRCALAMQRAMRELNAQHAQRGLPALEMGVGVDTGLVVAGNIGHPDCLRYTVIGPTVNLAARVESLTVGGQVLITEHTRSRLTVIPVVGATAEVMPKGAPEPVSVVEVLGIEGAPELMLEADRQPLRGVDVEVGWRGVEGKQLSEQVESARMVAVGPRSAVLVVDRSLEPGATLALVPAGGGVLYAKVLRVEDRRVHVRFADPSPDQQVWIDQLGAGLS